MTEIISPLPVLASQASDLEDVFANPAEDIKKIDTAIRALSPPTVRASRLYEVAARTLRNAKHADSIVRQAIYLSAFGRKTGRDAHGVIKGLELGLLRRREWDERRLGEFATHLGAFVNLIEAESVYLSSKALDLALDHDRVFTTARIVTDVRPVLNKDRTEARGAIVVHSLHLHYFEQDRSVEMTIAVDKADLEVLAAACREAIIKTTTAKQLVKGISEDNVFVVGEETYGTG